MQRRVKGFIWIAVFLQLLFSWDVIAQATTQSSSTHYGVNETQFGTGGITNDCSTSYCSRVSVGDTAVGNASSTNYTAQFGFVTANEPLLEVITAPGAQNLGVLGTDRTGTATATIKVRNYLSKGYIVQLTGSPPKQTAHTLTAMAYGASQQGVEQFGINLAANTTPSVGASVVQVPSSVFSFGTVATGYNTPNSFQYTDGDVVAQSASSSGETDYTLSMIVNISNLTPGGQYKGSLSAVVIPVY